MAEDSTEFLTLQQRARKKMKEMLERQFKSYYQVKFSSSSLYHFMLLNWEFLVHHNSHGFCTLCTLWTVVICFWHQTSADQYFGNAYHLKDTAVNQLQESGKRRKKNEVEREWWRKTGRFWKGQSSQAAIVPQVTASAPWKPLWSNNLLNAIDWTVDWLITTGIFAILIFVCALPDKGQSRLSSYLSFFCFPDW